jgi:hypothetical protein
MMTAPFVVIQVMRVNAYIGADWWTYVTAGYIHTEHQLSRDIKIDQY